MSEATPRPWRVFKNRDGTKLIGVGGQDGQGILDAGFGVWAWNDPEGIANAELAVHAVNNIDRITAERDGLLALAKFVTAHWDNQDMNHADFRVHAFRMTLSDTDADRKSIP